MKDLKSYVIDYTRPNGITDFATVHAENEIQAAKIFYSRGVDGWHGYKYSDYRIDSITVR